MGDGGSVEVDGGPARGRDGEVGLALGDDGLGVGQVQAALPIGLGLLLVPT